MITRNYYKYLSENEGGRPGEVDFTRSIQYTFLPYCVRKAYTAYCVVHICGHVPCAHTCAWACVRACARACAGIPHTPNTAPQSNQALTGLTFTGTTIEDVVWEQSAEGDVVWASRVKRLLPPSPKLHTV